MFEKIGNFLAFGEEIEESRKQALKDLESLTPEDREAIFIEQTTLEVETDMAIDDGML